MNKAIKFNVILGVFVVLGLTACNDSAVKRDQPAPPVSDKLKPDGHIVAKDTVEDEVNNSAAIPNLIQTQIPTLPPLGSGSSQSDSYSISAVGVPVTELLFKIAQDASKEIDIYSGVNGSITINALNQPLDKILDRMSEQANFIYELNGNTILIKPDLPEWRNYKVDYVNIKKTSKESIDMQMSVSSGVDGSGGAGGSPASSTEVKVESEHDFWTKLEDNIKLLAQLDPNANRMLMPQSGDKKGAKIELSSLSQNTVVNGEAGIISVYTTVKQHKAIKKYIDQVTKRAEQQVLIEATVVEVELNDQYQTGVDWSFINNRAFGNDGGIQISSPFGGSFTGFSATTVDNLGDATVGVLSGNWNILANLNLLDEFGDSKVLSSPKIMAVNNQTALLKVVENLVYFTIEVNTSATDSSSLTTYETEVHTLPVGFTMSVTPFVSENGEVTLNVRPTISKQVGFVKDPNPSLTVLESRIPVIQEKEMSSVLRLRDRQTAIIGGLIEDSNTNSRSGLPWVSDVPVLGDFFSLRDDSTRKRELIIFIRPTIIKNPDVNHGDLNSVSRFLKKTKNY